MIPSINFLILIFLPLVFAGRIKMRPVSLVKNRATIVLTQKSHDLATAFVLLLLA